MELEREYCGKYLNLKNFCFWARIKKSISMPLRRDRHRCRYWRAYKEGFRERSVYMGNGKFIHSYYYKE